MAMLVFTQSAELGDEGVNDIVACSDANTCKCCPPGSKLVNGICVPTDCGDATCENQGAVGGYCTACLTQSDCNVAGLSAGCWWDAAKDGKCLLDGMYWDGLECTGTSECGLEPSLKCTFRPPNDPLGGVPAWWGSVPGCIDTSAKRACCYFSNRYGQPNVYYDDPGTISDIVPYWFFYRGFVAMSLDIVSSGLE